MAKRCPLPALDGISPQKCVLYDQVPDSPQLWAAAAGDSPFPEGTPLPPGQVLERPTPAWFYPDVPPEPPIPFDYEILHHDDHLIIADKPHFLPTTTNGRIIRETLQTRLRVDLDNGDIVPLHRLDRLTAGVVVCSANPDTRAAYQRLFAERAVTKTYVAAVACRPNHPTWPGELAPAPAEWGSSGDRTWRRFRVGMKKKRGSRAVDVGSWPGYTRTETWLRPSSEPLTYQLRPVTGHTHQLRALLNHLGAPIRGDDTYLPQPPRSLYDFRTPLQLRASTVSFTDPLTGTRREFQSRRRLTLD